MGEELNITVKICRADLREEFLSLSVENVMIYLIVRKKDRNSMKIFKRKHTHTHTIQAAFEVNGFEIKSSHFTSHVKHILLTS